MTLVRHTVHFLGRVQGVGFRYTTVRIASDFAVAGYVQNMPDRRVLLVAEGDRSDLKSFVDEINSQMSGYIKDCTIDESEANGEFGAPGPGALDVRY